MSITNGKLLSVWPLHWRRLAVTFSDLSEYDPVALDRRINAVFGLETSEEESSPASVSDTSILVQIWVEKILQVRLALLQAAGVAVFEKGRVLSVTGGKGLGERWRVEIVLPDLVGTDTSLVALATRAAAQCLQWLKGLQSEEATEIAGLQNRIHERLLPALIGIVGPTRHSTLPLMKEAVAADIPFRRLFGGVHVLGWGKNAILMEPSAVDGDATIGTRLAHNKYWTAQYLKGAGLPSVRQVCARSVEQALAGAEAIGLPVVIKPVDCERGDGVTIDIASQAAVRHAAERALALSPSCQILVEPMLGGICHRLVMVGGKLLYAVRRGPKAVVGDGVRSVRTLIAQENAMNDRLPPWRRDPVWPADKLARLALQEAGYDFDSVPHAGALAPLRRIESTQDGGVDEDVTAFVHPDILDMARRVQQLFRLEVIGIDLMTEDISVSWRRASAIINEVNFAPVLGKAAISRSYLPGFFHCLKTKPARIPVDVVLGGGASGKRLADACYKRLVAEGLNAYLVDAAEAGLPVYAEGDIAGRLAALVLDRSAEALVILVEKPGDLATPWPIDRISAFHDSGEDWDGDSDGKERALAAARLQAACFT